MTERSSGKKCEREPRTDNEKNKDSPGGRRGTIEAANWYDRKHEGLGEEFADAVNIAIDLIEDDKLPLSPMPGKSGAKGVRRLILKRFPYDIVIIEGDIETIVIAVAHHSRLPGYWRERIGPQRLS